MFGTNEFALYETFLRLNREYELYLSDPKAARVVDRGTDHQSLEIIGERLEFNPKQKYFDFGDIRKTNREYCEKEMKWYDSQSLSIRGYMEDIAIWKRVADKNGMINSNYGWVIYSDENGNQFENVVKHLSENKSTRHGIMLFNRPSMHKEWNENGRSDFICSVSYHFFIRDDRLFAIYNWRSEDIIFGLTGSDFYFAAEIYERMHNRLVVTYPDLKYGSIIWFCDSLHIYERHWAMLPKLAEWYMQQLAEHYAKGKEQ